MQNSRMVTTFLDLFFTNDRTKSLGADVDGGRLVRVEEKTRKADKH